MSEIVRHRLLTAALVATAGIGGFVWGNYRWHQGFTMGADAVLCTVGLQVDGSEVAMRSDACRNISGKSPPWFPESLRPQGPPANIEVGHAD